MDNFPPSGSAPQRHAETTVLPNNAFNPATLTVTPQRHPFPTIPGYRFIQPIARSHHAEVLLAHSIELGHDVAVKVLRNSDRRALTPEQILRFERERELLMRIKHRAVVDLYDWGQCNSHGHESHFLVTEYFPAGSLELRIRNLMSVRDSIDIFVQIAGALVAIHRQGLCHRDLKPANAMLRRDGSVVLIDFGLAMTLESVSLTGIGEVFGSPYYISPEQIDGSSSGDHRSDLYSLGIMLFEMLTGARPFTGKSVVEIAHAHKSAPIPSLPAELQRFQPLINGLLAKDPNQRLQSATDALAELAKLKV